MASNPLDVVAQFRNQQLGALTTGTGDISGNRDTPQLSSFASSPDIALTGGEQAATNLSRAVSPVATANSGVGYQNRLLSSAIEAKRKAPAPKPSAGNMSSAGNAYRPDGTLSASRNAAVSDASSYLGSRYVLGGTTRQGIDCSGLVQMVYRKLGINSVHNAAWQGANIPGVRTAVNNLRAGDIVAWKDGSHIAIYAGNGYIIQAANPNQGVIKSRLDQQVGYNPNGVYGIALRLPGE